MKKIRKNREPGSLIAHRKSAHADYDNLPDAAKKDLRASLLEEQGYICCYCMQDINDDKMKIEHWESQSRDPSKQLNYDNLLAACPGNENKPANLQHCDTSKRNQALKINPAGKTNCEAFIKYSSNGTIYSHDPEVQRDLDQTLNLNMQTLKENRRQALKNVIKELTKIRGKEAPWPIAQMKRKIEAFESRVQGKYRPYCRFVVYILNKRIARER